MQTIALERNWPRDLALVLLASFVICLSGKISIPLWFTPVPIATQNAMVLLIAALLGSRRGTAATFAFLAQGAMGLPVFSTMGPSLQILMGPTGGYLIGYLIASFATGYLAERKHLALGLLVGNVIIYVCGASYLSTFVGPSKALLLGVVPFLLGDALKMIAGWKILQFVKRPG